MANRTRSKPIMHACPGGCGAQVNRALLACASCWWLLPQPMRAAITKWTTDHDGGARQLAVSEALTWYRANVVDGGLVDEVTL